MESKPKMLCLLEGGMIVVCTNGTLPLKSLQTQFSYHKMLVVFIMILSAKNLESAVF